MDAHEILKHAKARIAEIDKLAGALIEERAMLQRMVDGADGRLAQPIDLRPLAQPIDLRPLAPPTPTLIPMPHPMPYQPPGWPGIDHPWGTLIVTGSGLGCGAVG